MTWTGRHRVYDLEVADFNTFIAGGVAVHNCQSMDPDTLSVVDQCLAAAAEPVRFVAGTSLTTDTYLEGSWAHSSQGIWHVRCGACGFDNACCLEPDGHVLAMIGPPRDDVSEERPGTVCKQCRVPVNPRYGRWVHRYPERVRLSAGYHLPQPIFPLHYARPNKWAELVGAMNGANNFTTGRFYNEVLGEPYDDAYKLVSLEDLKKAAAGVGPNTPAAAAMRGRRYPVVVLGVDWGGGGKDGVSRTKVAAAGLAPDGRAEVFYGEQFPPSLDRVVEGKEVIRVAKLVGAQLVAHDLGSGPASESVLNHLGWPLSRIAGIVYRQSVGGPMLLFSPPAGARFRGYYGCDKGRSLQFTCMAIRAGRVGFFDFDWDGPDRTGLLSDFLALAELQVDTPTGKAYRVIKSATAQSDDFAHAVNYALMVLWGYSHAWPDLSAPGRTTPEPPE